MQLLIRLPPALLLGVAAAVLVSCGSSGSGLIPSASAGPLKSDFEEVAQAALAGNGNCVTTESALGKTEQDFLALPATIDKGLRTRLDQGIANLRKQALAMCTQLRPTDTVTTPTTTATTTTPPTTTTSTQTTPTTPATTPTVSTPTPGTPPSQSGGTEALEGQAEEGPGRGKGKAENEGNGGAGAGGASPGGER